MLKEEELWSIAETVFKDNDDAVFLHSGMKNTENNISILAWDTEQKVEGNSIEILRPHLSRNKNKYENAWFGYIGYETEIDETIKEHSKSNETSINMRKFNKIIEVDHSTRKTKLYGLKERELPKKTNVEETKVGIKYKIDQKEKNTYKQKIHEIKKKINNGVLLQTNLTRKIKGKFNKGLNPVYLYQQLCKKNPAPYNALLKFKNLVIVSSSPEKYISCTTDGEISTEPIKGTIRRSLNKNEDIKLKNQLQESHKDKAENLMIVDLCRNDLTKISKIGSIKVNKLFNVKSFKNIHHMATEIKGEIREDMERIDIIKNSFPPGSMTGAPKIKAIEIAEKYEPEKRGIYSGALGWFGGDGTIKLSVIIRTIIIRENEFEYQVGGAITTNSDPEEEWKETQSKEEGIKKTLRSIEM